MPETTEELEERLGMPIHTDVERELAAEVLAGRKALAQAREALEAHDMHVKIYGPEKSGYIIGNEEFWGPLRTALDALEVPDAE